MTNLLDFVLEAHDGLENWKKRRRRRLRLTLGGFLFEIKQHPDGLRTALVKVDARRPRTLISPFPEKGKRLPGWERSGFRPTRVRWSKNCRVPPMKAMNGARPSSFPDPHKQLRFPVEAPQARFHFTRPARSQNGSPAFDQPGQVFGVDHLLPAPAIGFAEAKVRILAPALTEEVDVPVRECSPYHTGMRVDDAAELAVHFAPSGTVAVISKCATVHATSIILWCRSAPVSAPPCPMPATIVA
jgi:hypothetical protein